MSKYAKVPHSVLRPATVQEEICAQAEIETVEIPIPDPVYLMKAIPDIQVQEDMHHMTTVVRAMMPELVRKQFVEALAPAYREIHELRKQLAEMVQLNIKLAEEVRSDYEASKDIEV